MKRRKNLYFGLGPAPAPTKRERARQRKEFQSGVRHKRGVYKRGREREASTLFKQLQKDAKPQRAHRAKMSPGDEERWRELLRANPHRRAELIEARKKNIFPAFLLDDYSALSTVKTLEGKTMATKKRKRRKKKMPAGLAAYWRKKRAQKNARKAKRRKRPNPKPRKKRRARRRNVYFDRRTMGLKLGKKPRARRRKRRNPPRKRRVKIIKTSLTGKKLRQFRAAMAAKYHAPARII